MFSKGYGQIRHKNNRGFHLPSTFFKLFMQPLKINSDFFVTV
jgi:hypothetical protein